jgi:hypothetical protein
MRELLFIAAVLFSIYAWLANPCRSINNAGECGAKAECIWMGPKHHEVPCQSRFIEDHANLEIQFESR